MKTPHFDVLGSGRTSRSVQGRVMHLSAVHPGDHLYSVHDDHSCLWGRSVARSDIGDVPDERQLYGSLWTRCVLWLT